MADWVLYLSNAGLGIQSALTACAAHPLRMPEKGH